MYSTFIDTHKNDTFYSCQYGKHMKAISGYTRKSFDTASGKKSHYYLSPALNRNLNQMTFLLSVLIHSS
jgi:hypothetical protein